VNSDFRQRVLIPLLLPFGTLLAILAVAYSLSRVLLTVPPTVAAFTALGVAGYVLLVAFMIERRPRISGRALGVGLTVGLVALGVAGAVAAAAGPRPLEEHAVAEGATEDAAADAPLDEVPEDATLFVGDPEIAWEEVPDEVSAGNVQIALEITGIAHNVTFEGENGDQPVVEGELPGFYVGNIELAPGEYTYYCSIPGHRAPMEGTLTVN
jgi:plastocyanin